MSSYELGGTGDDLRDVIDRLNGSTRPPTVRYLLQLADVADMRDRQIEEELKRMLQEGSGGEA